jgi:predicted alpha/beta-hydrolase family hydrolase
MQAPMSRIEKLHIATDAGETVSAEATLPPQPEAAFVFAHGAGAGMNHPFMTAVAQGLAERHIACLRYQFPYMEAARRRVDTAPVAHATVRAAVAAAASLWGPLPLFAGGKSYGGRMTSQAQAIAPLPGVAGLVFLGFPLHPSGKPDAARAQHLASIGIPMLFIRGTRDALAEASRFDPVIAHLGDMASRFDIAEADHTFQVLRRSGRDEEDVLAEVLDGLTLWTQAWRIRPSPG